MCGQRSILKDYNWMFLVASLWTFFSFTIVSETRPELHAELKGITVFYNRLTTYILLYFLIFNYCFSVFLTNMFS